MNFKRLETYLNEIQKTVYVEPEFDYHHKISEGLVNQVTDKFKDILDVGFGQGYSLKKFKERGFNVKGITLSEQEYRDFEIQGYDVHIMDMSFLDFDDESFDLVWCRHALEHSVMPFISLKEFRRVLRRGGVLFVEVPSDNVAQIKNPNHYSLFSDHAWQELFEKAGFDLTHRLQTRVIHQGWDDIYWQYWLRKK